MKPHLWTLIPYCHRQEGSPPGYDVGLAYNQSMALVPDGDWAVILDHDVSFTSRTWFRLVEEAIRTQPDAGAFVPVTNRLVPTLSGWQMAQEVDVQNNDMVYHWSIGHARRSQFGASVQDVTDIDKHGGAALFSGFCFIVSKATWTLIGGAQEGSGMYGVDWGIHDRIRSHGKRVYLLPGLYLYHWYKYDKRFSDA